MFTPVRWKQRFQNFEKAYNLLTKIADIKDPSEGERIGLIQAFEMSFELAWKLLADYQKANGYDIKSPRDSLKQAFQDGLIQDGRSWLEAMESRNDTVHTYDEAKALQIETQIRKQYLHLFKELYSHFHGKYTTE